MRITKKFIQQKYDIVYTASHYRYALKARTMGWLCVMVHASREAFFLLNWKKTMSQGWAFYANLCISTTGVHMAENTEAA